MRRVLSLGLGLYLCLRASLFFKESNGALDSFKEMVMEEDRKHLFDKRFDLVKELVVASHKVMSEPTYYCSLNILFGVLTPLTSIFQLVQIGHAFDREWDRHSSTIKKLWADRNSARNDRYEFQTKLVAITFELGDMRLIAQHKERELASEREKTKKALKEASMLKETVGSLSSRMS